MKNLKRSYAVVCDRPAEMLDAKARFDRAHALANAGRHAEAVDAYRALAATTDQFPWLGLNLGVSLVALGRLPEAADAFALATYAMPAHSLGWCNLGAVLGRLGRFEEAAQVLRQAWTLAPEDVSIPLNLSRALVRTRYEEAVPVAEAAVRLDPTNADAWRTLADARHVFGQPDGALEAYARAQALDPECLLRDSNDFGNALVARGRLDELIAHCDATLRLRPDAHEAWGNRGIACLNEGDVPGAIAALRRALELDPENEHTHSNLLLAHTYVGEGNEALLAEAKAWERAHSGSPLPSGGEGAGGEGSGKAIRLPTVRTRRSARLRVGYLSADFHAHPAGYLYEALFPHHDHSRFEIFAYANQFGGDAVTERIAASVDHWACVIADSDDALARRIQDDHIDVLVDLLGHTPGHRLKAFARRLAPVQATWLGYFGTTGLREMDFIVADRHILPEGHEPFYTERPARMPGCLYVFQPPRLDLAPGSPPALAKGYPTFGCFNNVAKITPETVALWCEVLRALPESRMRLNRWPFATERVRTRYQALFAANGVDPARVEFRATSGREAYFEGYRDVDVMLDTFPYGGGTTTMEALWMGVPVVSLPAERFVGRMTTTLLHAVKRPELLVESPTEFVQLALDLATELPSLAELRDHLRHEVEASALCDLPRYTRDLESTFEWMWENRAHR